MLSIEKILIISLFLLYILVQFVLWFLQIRKNKRIIASLEPTRFLEDEETAALNFLEIDCNLMVDLLPLNKIREEQIYKSIWKFSQIDFTIRKVYFRKKIQHSFYLEINGEVISIVVPDVFLPYLTPGSSYKNKNIEIIFRRSSLMLFSLEGVIGYPSLYKKFQYEQNPHLERKPTKKELYAFSLSKWSSIWGLIFPFLFPFFVLEVMDEEFGFDFVLISFLLLVSFLFFKAYLKRKKYIESRLVHTLNGKIWFDEDQVVYRIGEEELKLHRKWEKEIQRHNLPIENATMEAFLHSYDSLSISVGRKFQPLSIKSDTLEINESDIKSTRGWELPLVYLIAFGTVAIFTPSVVETGNFILDPNYFSKIKGNYFFVIFMNFIWWGSIFFTIHYIYLVAIRIKGNYFDN